MVNDRDNIYNEVSYYHEDEGLLKIGKIQYIEPCNINSYGLKNGSDLDIPHPYEDYCTSVDLIVKMSNINSCGMPENFGDSFNDELVFSTTNGTMSFMAGTDGELTTKYSDVTPLDPQNGSNECIGIQSIDISYTNWMVPTVTIKFVDIRGGAIMLPSEYDEYKKLETRSTNSTNGMRDDSSPFREKSLNGAELYKALFSFPYPLFMLKVKGFYGHEVTYNLALSKFIASFDNESGNFNITCTFIGYLYGIFADVPMTLLAIGPYIQDYGVSYWNNQKKAGNFVFRGEDENGGKGSDMKTFIEYKKDIESISDKVKKNELATAENDAFKAANGKLSMLANIGFIYGPRNDSGFTDEDSVLVWNYNPDSKIYYYVSTNSDRSNVIRKNEYGRLLNVERKISEYNKAYDDDKLTSLKLDMIPDGATTKSELNPVVILEKETVTTGDRNYYYISIKSANGATKNMPIERLVERYPALRKVISSSGMILDGNGGVKEICIFELNCTYNHKQEIDEKEDKQREIVKTAKEKLNETYLTEIQKILKFSPSIRNMFNMTFAHMETFLACFYNCLKKIDSSWQTRTIKNYKVSLNDMDCPYNYTAENAIPPFTMFNGISERDGVKVNKFPTDIDPALASLPEVEFVYDIIRAASEMTRDDDFTINPAPELDNLNRKNGFIPTTLYDVMYKTSNYNPYSVIVSKWNTLKQFSIYHLIYTFMIRCYYYALTTNILTTKNSENMRAFAYCEAHNLMDAIDKSVEGGSVKKKLRDYLSSKETSYDVINNVIRDMYRKVFEGGFNKLKAPLAIKTTNTDVDEYNNCFRILGDNLSYALRKSVFDDIYFPIGEINFEEIKENTVSKKFSNKYIKLFDSDKNLVTSENEGTFKLCIGPRDFESIFSNFSAIPASAYDKYDNKTEVLPYKDLFLDIKMSSQKQTPLLQLENLIQHKENDGDPVIPTIEQAYYIENAYTESNADRSAIDTHKILRVNDKYMVMNYDSGTTANRKIKFTDSLFNEAYYLQGNYGKAYLILYSIEGTSNSFLNVNQDRISNGIYQNIELLKEGAHYWRYDTGTQGGGWIDPITGTMFKHCGKNEVYSPVLSNSDTYYRGLKLVSANSNDDSFASVPVNYKATKGRREQLKLFFKTWVDNNVEYLGNYQTFMKNLLAESNIDRTVLDDKGNITNKTYYNKTRQVSLLNVLCSVSFIIDIANINSTNGNVGFEPIQNSVYRFVDCLKGLVEEINDSAALSYGVKSYSNNIMFQNSDLCLTVYKMLKNLYERWICNTSFRKWQLGTSDSYFNRFRYIDNFYNDISDKLIVSPQFISEMIKTFTNTADNEGMVKNKAFNSDSVFNYLHSIASKNGCLMVPTPNLFTGGSNIVDVFTPQPFTSKSTDDMSTFVVIYTQQPGKDLNFKSKSSHDSFPIANEQGTKVSKELPTSLTNGTSTPEDMGIAAFGVTYAKGNQSYFTNISVDSNKKTMTDIAIQTTLSIAGRDSGPNEALSMGQDLYSVYSTYAYTCNVEMMGDMQIMPLMYFQLNNIPMWKGTYMILNVKHAFRAGQCQTSFSGVRITKNNIPLSNGYVLYAKSLIDVDTINENKTRNASQDDNTVLHDKNVTNFKKAKNSNQISLLSNEYKASLAASTATLYPVVDSSLNPAQNVIKNAAIINSFTDLQAEIKRAVGNVTNETYSKLLIDRYNYKAYQYRENASVDDIMSDFGVTTFGVTGNVIQPSNFDVVIAYESGNSKDRLSTIMIYHALNGWMSNKVVGAFKLPSNDTSKKWTYLYFKAPN